MIKKSIICTLFVLSILSSPYLMAQNKDDKKKDVEEKKELTSDKKKEDKDKKEDKSTKCKKDPLENKTVCN